jgi:signal transduction histidine kinase
MLVKRFYLNLVLHMVLILATMSFQAFAIRDLVEGQHLFTFIVLSGFLVLQVVLLFRYLRKTNRQLTKFVLAIANQDFTLKFGKEKGKTPHKELNQAFNKIIAQYQSVYMEKESQTFLMHHLVKEIPAGIMVLNQDGGLLEKNQAIERLLKLEEGQPGFYEKIVKPGIPGTYHHKLSASGEQLDLSIHVSEFLLMNKLHKIVLVQDISKEVNAGEVDAIQRLLRILTHEIMNSLAPVQSLTETITMLMTDAEGRPREQESLSQRNYNDILESVQAIQERAGGLDRFVNRFRTLTRLPETLETEAVLVKDLFESVGKIMHAELDHVDLRTDLESENLEIRVDPALVEQVLINLINNSLTAMSTQPAPLLILKAKQSDAYITVQVVDNGSGIPEEKLSDIFMPFYSTKEQASGIGLSFVKQILRLHNASIHVRSAIGEGSTFSIRFPKAG